MDGAWRNHFARPQIKVVVGLLASLAMTLTLATGAVAGESREIQNLKAKAAAGDVDAQLHLAAAYDSGRGVKLDIIEAAKWYEAAANLGNAEAQNSIGSLYLQGAGVPKDGVRACDWFAKSAAQKNVRGIGNLGICYDSGIGVAKDQSRAARQYEEAANAGDLQSMLNIGVDYWHGEGVEKDLVKAYMWFDLVRFYTQTGDANRMLKWRARSALETLSRQITPQIEQDGEALSHAWDRANRDKVQRSTKF